MNPLLALGLALALGVAGALIAGAPFHGVLAGLCILLAAFFLFYAAEQAQ